jgi:hypothetical protein
MAINEIEQKATGHSRPEQAPYDPKPPEITDKIPLPTEPQAVFSLATFLKNNVWALLPAIVLMIAGVHINTIEFWLDMAAIIFTMHFYSKFGKR